MKTFSAKTGEINQDWYLLDAEERVLGRVAAAVAHRLRGKHKAIYTPHVDTGDYVVIVNAAKVKVTGNKRANKVYHRHTGFPGGIRTINFSDMQDKNPGRAILLAVRGMLPKGRLGRSMLKKLKVYPGANHPHQAQMPKELVLKGI